MKLTAHLMGLTAVHRPVSAFFVAAALFFLTSFSSSPAFAAAPPQPTIPEILLTDIDVKDTKDNIRDLFEPAEPVMIEVVITDTRFLAEVSDDDPNISQDYIVVLNVYGPRDIPLYDSLEEDESIEISSLPEQQQLVAFRWKIPLISRRGGYDVFVSIRRLDDPTTVIDEVDDGFFVEVNAELFVSKLLVDFGLVEEDDTPSEDIIVANAGDGILVWKITEYPDDWLDLVSPNLNQTQLDTGRITLKVLETALLGEFRGELVIESNAGDKDVTIMASIDRNPDGDFTRIRAQDKSVKPGELLDFVFRIENEGDVDIDYRAIFSIVGPSNSVIYNSNLAGEDLLIHVRSGDESDNTTFTWAVPYGSLPGEYMITAQLRNYHDWEMDPFVSKIEGDVFDVERGPLISASPGSWAFGTIISGETPSAGFDVVNDGRGTIEWEISNWPTWIELLRPTGPVSGEGTIQIRVRGDTPASSLAGAIEIASNGGPMSIPISTHVLPPPTPTISVATVLAQVATPTPSPTNTPRPTITPIRVASPTATPARPAIFNGAIAVDGNVLSESARLVAVIGDYETFPALIQDRRYINLVIAPPEPSYVGEEITFLLDGVPSEPLLSSVHFLPGQDRTINLSFVVPTSAASTPTPLRATATALAPSPPLVASLLTVTPTPPPPTAVPEVSPTQAAEVETQVAIPEGADGDGDRPSPGGCSRTTEISLGAALGNGLLLLGPLGLIAALKTRRRANKLKR
ncbi:MAG: hypothetical protein IH861_12025 [Chloroflexi bacterium]|nr:hypothetical protein [Chloroflexota bacterium]